MPPSSHEPHPFSSSEYSGGFIHCITHQHQSARIRTVARVFCAGLVFLSVFMLIAISSTRTFTNSQQIMPQQQADEQLQKYKSELRSLTRKLQWQLKKLTLESDAGRRIQFKREANHASTSSLASKSISSIVTPTVNLLSNFTNLTSSSSNDSWIKQGLSLDETILPTLASINSTNATFISDTKTASTFPHPTSGRVENSTNTPAVNSRASLAPIDADTVTETVDVQSSTQFDLSAMEDVLRNATRCVQFTEEQLVKELKQHGTYNPDFMAWDVRGVLNFFERASTDNYDKLKKSQARAMTIEQNLAAVEQLVKELNLQNCNLRTPDVLARLYNLSSTLPARGGMATSLESTDYGRLRTKRDEEDTNEHDPTMLAKAKYIYDLYMNKGASRDDSLDSKSRSTGYPWKTSAENDGIIGQVHVVPSGCRKRGSSEDGYLRLCSACQAIRRLPDTFFPPFLNEVTCDEDKACLYFYDYPHGKCRQKHLNLVVLKNVGTSDCQLWKRYNLNVRVSCECFVDEMSFFAKYV